jgi:glutathione S-transferase
MGATGRMLGSLPMQLVTIAFSHYNEKARWALDHFGAPYREVRCMPVLHFPAVMWATRLRGGRSDRASTRWSTPVLVTDDGERLCDSSAIVRWASDRFGTPATTLYPAEHREEIEALERRLGDTVGPHVRRLVYAHLLPEPELLARLARDNVGPLQARTFAAMSPLVRLVLRRALAIEPRRAEASLGRVREEMAALEERLGDRPYLVGDRFTAADLTAACLLAPAVLVSHGEGYGAVMPELSALPPELAALIGELRQTRIGQYCLQMFAHQRRARAH